MEKRLPNNYGGVTAVSVFIYPSEKKNKVTIYAFSETAL